METTTDISPSAIANCASPDVPHQDLISRQTRHYCPICDTHFTRASHLRRHAFTHQTVKAFGCNTCSRSFKRQDTLRRHEASHHLDASIPGVSGLGRACFACIKARAKCSRDAPCRRCDARQVNCRYPGLDPSNTRPSIDTHDNTLESRIPQSIPTAESGGSIQRDQDVAHLPYASISSAVDNAVSSTGTTDVSSHAIFAQDIEPLDAPYTFQNDFYPNPTTSVNWLSMDLNDWDFSVDITAMSQGFQAVNQDVNTGGGQDDLIPDQTKERPSPSRLSRHANPQSSYAMHSSPNVHLETRPSPDNSNTASTPSSQMQNVIGGLYRHGQGSRLARQRAVFAKAGYDSLLSHDSGDMLKAGFQIVHMELSTDEGLGLDGGFPIHEEAYAAIIANYRSICLTSGPAHPAFLQGDFISHRTMEACIAIFFKTLGTGIPVVHAPTLVLDKQNWLLALALCTAGCSVLESPQNKRSLLEFLKRALSQETSLWTNSNSPEKTLQFAQANLIASILLRLQNQDQGFHAASTLSVLLLICKRSNWLGIGKDSVCVSLDQSADEIDRDWKQWALRESQVRVAYAALLEDQVSSNDKDLCATGSASLCEVKGHLPANEDVWHASSAEEWTHVASNTELSFHLQGVLETLYAGGTPHRDLGDFARIAVVHALCRRVSDIRNRHDISLWGSNYEDDSSIVDRRIQDDQEQPQPSNYDVWRNSTLDCLDIIHWHAHEVTVQDWGLEPSRVLHLHMARLILLVPTQDIEKLIWLRTMNPRSAQSEPYMWFLKDTKSHQVSMTNVARWLRQDHFKARLAVVHAGALLWYMKRFSAGSHFEPTAVWMACLTIWAYGAYYRLLYDSALPEEQHDQAQKAHLPPMIQIDRPCDDELVQIFIRRGTMVPPYMTGVGFVCESGSAARVPRLGVDLLATRCHSSGLCEHYRSQLSQLAESCGG